jgi:integrase
VYDSPLISWLFFKTVRAGLAVATSISEAIREERVRRAAGRKDSSLAAKLSLHPFGKRFARPLLDFLSQKEMQAILQAMDNSWIGRRDHLLFLFL